MKRVILASHDERDIQRAKCERWYNAILDAEDPRNLSREQIIIYVSDHANVSYDIAVYFVDQFLSQESDPLPLKGSSQVDQSNKIQASDDQFDSEETSMRDYLWEIIDGVSGAGIFNIDLAKEWDHVIIDFEPTSDYESIESRIVEAFQNEGFNPIVIYNTGSEIVLEVPGLESQTNVSSSTSIDSKQSVQASNETVYIGRRIEVDKDDDIELICYDPEYDEEFEKYIGQGDTATHNLRVLKRDRCFDVSDDLLRQIEELI